MKAYDELMLMLISQQNQINKLDNEIKELRKIISNYNNNEPTGLIMTKNMSDEKFDKNDIIRFIKLELSDLNLDTSKASREKGGGVIFKNKETGQQKIAMLRRSRNYVYDNPKKFPDYIFRSWHTMDATLLDYYDLFIFSIEGTIAEPVNFFIFSKEELNSILQKKNKDKNNKYHFYFIKTKDGQILEYRDGKINIKKYLNNWNTIKKNR